MEQSELLKLVEEVTEDLFAKNIHVLEQEGVFSETIKLAVQLSAITTVKILERLDLMDKG